MALSITGLNAADVYTQLKALGANVRALALKMQAATASMSLELVRGTLDSANALLAYIATVQADTTLTANLIAYIQSIEASTTVAADFAASLAALQALQIALIKDYPVDSAGHVLDRTMDAATGAVNPVNVTQAQLPNTMSAITAWLATVK